MKDTDHKPCFNYTRFGIFLFNYCVCVVVRDGDLELLFILLYYVTVSVHFSCSVLSDSLWPHGLQHARQLLEFIQTHVHWDSDAIQQSHTLSSPSPPAFNRSQHHGIFIRVGCSHQVAKVLEFYFFLFLFFKVSPCVYLFIFIF